MNLTQIYAEVGRLLNDPNNQRWTQDVIKDRVNQAQAEVMGFTDALKTEETLTVTLDTQAVTLDANVMDVMGVVIQRANGDLIPLEGTTEYDLDFDYPNWRNLSSGDPMTWFYKASNQTLNLVPPPSAPNVISNGLTVTEIRVPADVSSGSDIPFDSNNQLKPYHFAIVHWVVAQCWMDDGTPEALSKSKFHKSGSMMKPGAYEDEIMRINNEFDNPKLPRQIKYQKQGGRLGSWAPSKTNPLGSW